MYVPSDVGEEERDSLRYVLIHALVPQVVTHMPALCVHQKSADRLVFANMSEFSLEAKGYTLSSIEQQREREREREIRYSLHQERIFQRT